MRLLEITDVNAFSSLIPPDSAYISYQLHFVLPAAAVVEVGKSGVHAFPAGTYVYTGSAKRNIRARVLRHLSRRKRLRWHIDYLLSIPETHFSKVLLSRLGECELNRQTAGKILVRGFGSTDCRLGCGSHLKFIDDTKRTNRQTQANVKPVRRNLT